MTWKSDGKIIGVGPELVRIIFGELGIPVKSRVQPWERTLESAKTGELDVIANIYFTRQRTKFLEYCSPHYSEAKTVVITKKGRKIPFTKWEDLIGLKGGTTVGDSWGEAFDRFMAEKLDVDRVNTSSQNLDKLQAGRIDYVIASGHSAVITAEKFGHSGKITIQPVPINSEKEYIAISKKSPYLKYLPNVNRKLAELIKSGTVEKLVQKYARKASSE